ncbi:conserved hypothetical protein [Histoplasma capsulatum G186AR]|uniref:Uncharacterized protein n=2 Tax=Ajellomyces capsulatus TaxID=5037 RepID=C0NCT9_AJECG|nr:uncharacterized protein HCBG_00935 [Histoplasma capsulatum G186AR]EEH11480.1 conserved hypothetical protein [Histoplasma capsulatum G186AR]KAG5302676.1 hypothetical protein I7I52_00392 [Histoplasma capsulatum]QSS71923.1 hypothetical protein I7I50_02942 [Histoplasma capsulatum G186AR]
MSRCRHRLYRALQQHGTARPDYIWISDELVYEGFFRFTRIHKRCSSSVPGPLEAQKRLSKRRHTALALMRSHPPSMEAAILFGKPEQQNSDVHPVGVHPWSPQALEAFPYLHNDVPPVPQAWKDDNTRNSQFDTILDNTAPPSSPSYAFLRMHLSSSAWKSSSLNEFKKYIAVLGLDPQGRSLISRIALSEILLVQNRSGRSKRWNIDDLHGFFSDPFLNVPAAENYVTLVEHCTMHTERKSRLYAHFRFLKRSIMLGLVPVEEIAKIIKLIPLIKTKTREHGKSTIGKANWADVATCYQAIWDGLKASSVLTPSDLGRETMTLWVEEILKVSPHGRLSQLGMDVIHALDGSGAAGLNLAGDVLLRRIVLTAASVPESTNIDIPDDALHGTLLYARSLLNSCPPEVAVAHILKITELLVFSPVYTKWGSQSLRIWYWVLSRLDNDLVLFSATSRSNLDSASSLTSSTTWDTTGLDIPNRLRNLLKLWVLAVLGHTTDSYAILDSRRRNVFRRLLSSLDRASGPFRGTDILTRLRIYFQDSRLRVLSATDLVLSNAADIEFSIAQKQFRWNRESGHAGGPDCLDPVIKATLLNPTHSPKTIKEILPYFSMYTRNRAAIYATFDQLAKSTDVTSSSFIHQIITFTEAGAIPRSAILRLLRRHTPLKVALSRCWQEPAPTYAITEPRAPQPDPSLYPNPNECLRMLHILALVFACTTTVTPTTSWRLTQWVYLFIVQHHGPVSPILARALFQAGVTRYREAGKPVPKRKYAFIMQKIREAEGAAVANALLDAEMF